MPQYKVSAIREGREGWKFLGNVTAKSAASVKRKIRRKRKAWFEGARKSKIRAVLKK